MPADAGQRFKLSTEEVSVSLRISRLLATVVLPFLLSCRPGDSRVRPAADPPGRSAPRVVAIGDLHGRPGLARRCLQLAGAIDARGSWRGGSLIVVQTGDQIDRGPDDRAVLDLFRDLARQATAQGGQVISLLGNHETKNVEGRFQYVAPGAWAAFAGFHAAGAVDPDADRFPPERRGRRVAFRPGGPYALRLAERPVVAIVGDSLFVHGGIGPAYVEKGIAHLNDLARAWLKGPIGDLPARLQQRDSPLWDRTYSTSPTPEDCAVLGQMLGRLGLHRLVVGHTPQRAGISSACAGRVWRIDTGMWRPRGGPVQVLEIVGGAVRVIRSVEGHDREPDR